MLTYGLEWCVLIAYYCDVFITEMQTGKGEKKVRTRGMLHMDFFFFKDICFTCSFLVTLRYFKKYMFYYLICPKQ